MAKQKQLTPEERQKLFEATLKSIQKDFGIHGSQVLGEMKLVKIPRMSFGSFAIDELVGGGNPKGRIIEVIGPESSGKTTIALHAVAEAQKEGVVAYIDAEHALDLNYAEALGVDVSNLVLAQPDTAEQCLQIAERWINSGICSMVVIDSVASMIPKNEMEGEIGDNHVGLLARLMSQALRKIAYSCNRSGTNAIFINQIREKVGVMFGNPETTPGGRALKYYSTIRLDIRPAEIQKTEGVATSRKTKIKAIKNKVGSPHRETTVDIEFGVGISKAGEVLDFGENLGILHKQGSWYWYGEHRIGNGRSTCKEILNGDKELLNELVEKIRSYLNPEPEEYTPTPEEQLKEVAFTEEKEEVQE
jgi:recombination protein RecA